MPTTYSTNLALTLIGTGEEAGTWGNTTNTNLGTLLEQAISGYVTQAVSTGTDTTLTIPNGATGVARNMYIELTGTGGTNTNLIVPANRKLYYIYNNTSSGQVTVKVSGQAGISVPNGKRYSLVSNGTDIVVAFNDLAGSVSSAVTATTATTATNLGGGAANRIAYQTGVGATSFVAAPTTASTYLQWNGSALTWASVTPPGQVVSARLTTTLDIGQVSIPNDNTIPQSNEGTQVLTATITPTTSTSKLVIQFMGQSGAQDGDTLISALFKDSDANALCAMPITYGSDTSAQYNLIYTMTSGTTSAITFKVRCGPNTAVSANRLLLNQSTYGGVTGTFLIITETV